jgi:UDP-N-acetylglucosamine--N-acetylmuramyl-(pentapeptide) pyrophosphoryl-undecaprenol N-acetylglucosamine transferase
MRRVESLSSVLFGLCAAESPAAAARRIVIAGGGTGGHLFPGITIAEEFMRRNPDNATLFVSSGNAFERAALSRAGYPLKAVRIEGIKGKGLLKKIKAASLIPWSIVSARRILQDFRPDLVVGVGSYAAGPVVVAGRMLGIPSVLHEQNRLPGMTNRLLARFADRIYVSFESTTADFSTEKVRFTGNPVRGKILRLVEAPSLSQTDPVHTGARRLNILIIGGSQGAHQINLTVVEALTRLTPADEFQFIHQTGAADAAWVRQAYERCGIQADVRPFFDDMDRQYQKADLMICRAGATTVAEVTAIGKAVLFIPFPFATDNHQVVNARALQDQGAAEMFEEKDLDAGLLAKRIQYYAAHRQELERMAQKAKTFGKPEAAQLIVDDIYEIMATLNGETKAR